MSRTVLPQNPKPYHNPLLLPHFHCVSGKQGLSVTSPHVNSLTSQDSPDINHSGIQHSSTTESSTQDALPTQLPTRMGTSLSGIPRAAVRDPPQRFELPRTARKRSGGYEWMFPARVTLPRITTTQSPLDTAVASRSVTDLPSEGHTHMEDSRSLAFTPARVSADCGSYNDDELYIVIQSVKQPATR